MNPSHPPSALVRWYVARIKPRTRGKPANWDEAWVQGTIRFGWQLLVVGLALLAGCFALPDDDRRWYVAAFALITAAVGAWHVRNARAVCELALRRANRNG